MKQVSLKLVFIFSVWTFKTRGSRLKWKPLRKPRDYQIPDGLGSKSIPSGVWRDSTEGTQVYEPVTGKTLCPELPIISIVTKQSMKYAVSSQKLITWLRLGIHLEAELGFKPSGCDPNSICFPHVVPVWPQAVTKKMQDLSPITLNGAQLHLLPYL